MLKIISTSYLLDITFTVSGNTNITLGTNSPFPVIDEAIINPKPTAAFWDTYKSLEELVKNSSMGTTIKDTLYKVYEGYGGMFLSQSLISFEFKINEL